jgi:hypothetical protein
MAAEQVRGGRRAPRSGPGGATRRIAATAAAVALAVAPLSLPVSGVLPDPANAAATTTVTAAATTTAGSEETTIALTAAPGANGIARPGEPLSVRVTVSNLGTEATPPLSLALDIAGAVGADAATVARWVAGETLEVDARTAATAALSPLDPGASAVLDLIVDDASAVLSGRFGARLAVVRASDENGLIAADRSALVWVGSTSAPPAAGTVFVAPIATPGIADGLLSADQLALLTGEAGSLTRQLDAVAGRPVLVGIDPRVVASIRLLGSTAPASATAFLDRLAAMPNETFLLPWADADLVAVSAAGAGPLPEPEGAGTVEETTETDEPTASPEPGPAPLTLAEAAAWPTTFRDVVWAEHGLDSAVLTALTDAGARLLLTPSTALEGAATVQESDALRLLRVDAALTAAAREASTAPSQQRFDRAIARLSALLAASAAAEPGIPAVIALTRDELPSSDRLVDTIARTVSLPWSTASAASAVLNSPAAPAELVAEPLGPSRLDAVQAALAAEAADRAFAAIATAPAAITDARRLELLAALSVGWGDTAPEALEGFVDDSITLRQSVRVAESSAITLLADRASLPVTVQNDLDVAVRVFVNVAPDTTQLRVLDPRVEVLVEPRSQTRALVPVESLTNGQVAITVTVRDAAGTRIGSPTRVDLNLQAGWETAGTIAFAGALVLLLGVGITRDIRKRRRRGAEAS